MPSALSRLWSLDPGVAFLNHGSFGACPRVVLEAQSELRAELEREPVVFFTRALERRLDEAREVLGAFLGADAEGLAFVQNATLGVNTALRALPVEPGDELLTTDHEYNACKNALDDVARRAGATVRVAHVPFPLPREDDAVDAVTGAVGPRTRFALLDHVTSPTGVVMPIARLVRALADRGVDTVVDGAHAPGMVDLDLRAIGAAAYAGNAHKWLCAPKGAAFLWVRADWRERLRPLVISHGANSPRTERSRFRLEFDWTGTSDPTPALCVPAALRYVGGLLPGGWPAVRAHNRDLALAARRVLGESLGVAAPCPPSMIGALAALPLPDAHGASARSALYDDPLHDALYDRHRIEVPIVPWPAPPRRLVRVSAQLYNDLDDYRALARALAVELAS